MTLVEIYNLIEALSLAQPNVHSFVMEFSDLNREDTQYSAVICQQRQHVHNGDFMTYNFYLGYADKMSDLENDEVEIHSTGINILNTIVTLVNENEGIYATSSEYIDAKEKFEAECAVVYCSLAVEVPSACYTMDNPFKPYLKDYYTKGETDDAITEAIDNQPFKTINGMDITGIGNINIKGSVTEEQEERIAEIPTLISDVNELKDNKADKSWVEEQGFAKESDIPDVSSFITMSDVEAKDYVTEQALDQKGYLTEIPSDVARKSDIPDTYSKTEIDSMIGDIDSLLNQILG